MVRGKNGDKRLKYIHVSPKGTTVITPHVVARVSLPEVHYTSLNPAAIIPQAEVDKVRLAPESEETVELPEGLPAVTQPDYLVPQVDKCFPAPEHQTAAFTCNADLLRKLLTVACEVSKDSDRVVRLRICGDFNTLRIDTYRQPGDQEFCGVLKGIDYVGDYIPGEAPSDAPKVEKKPVQKAMKLVAPVGRRFRGVGE